MHIYYLFGRLQLDISFDACLQMEDSSHHKIRLNNSEIRAKNHSRFILLLLPQLGYMLFRAIRIPKRFGTLIPTIVKQ